MLIKLCPKCKREKEIALFSKNKHTKTGLSTWCKECSAAETGSWRNVDGNKERLAQWRKDNIEKCTAHARKSNLKIKFKMSIEDYNALLDSQNGKCSLCNKTPEENGKALSVDHNHKTGKVRGLLCDNCNKGIGFLKENTEILQKAIKYIEKDK